MAVEGGETRRVEDGEIEGWKRSTSDKLAGIGAECGGVTRGVVWISWIGNGVDKIVSGIRSGGMRHMLGVGRGRKVSLGPTSMDLFRRGCERFDWIPWVGLGWLSWAVLAVSPAYVVIFSFPAAWAASLGDASSARLS